MLGSIAQGEVNYDHRRRDLRIENDRNFALCETRRLLERCATIPLRALELPICVRSKVSYPGDTAPMSNSSVARELMYAVAHAIHHYALVAVICHLHGVRVPAGFGVAPSTLQHRATTRMSDSGRRNGSQSSAAGFTHSRYNQQVEEAA